MKVELPLIKNALKRLAKGVIIPLGLTPPASAADIGIHKKFSIHSIDNFKLRHGRYYENCLIS